jgi:hypothetical protein
MGTGHTTDRSSPPSKKVKETLGQRAPKTTATTPPHGAKEVEHWLRDHLPLDEIDGSWTTKDERGGFIVYKEYRGTKIKHTHMDLSDMADFQESDTDYDVEYDAVTWDSGGNAYEEWPLTTTEFTERVQEVGLSEGMCTDEDITENDAIVGHRYIITVAGVGHIRTHLIPLTRTEAEAAVKWLSEYATFDSDSDTLGKWEVKQDTIEAPDSAPKYTAVIRIKWQPDGRHWMFDDVFSGLIYDFRAQLARTDYLELEMVRFSREEFTGGHYEVCVVTESGLLAIRDALTRESPPPLGANQVVKWLQARLPFKGIYRMLTPWTVEEGLSGYIVYTEYTGEQKMHKADDWSLTTAEFTKRARSAGLLEEPERMYTDVDIKKGDTIVGHRYIITAAGVDHIRKHIIPLIVTRHQALAVADWLSDHTTPGMGSWLPERVWRRGPYESVPVYRAVLYRNPSKDTGDYEAIHRKLLEIDYMEPDMILVNLNSRYSTGVALTVIDNGVRAIRDGLAKKAAEKALDAFVVGVHGAHQKPQHTPLDSLVRSSMFDQNILRTVKDMMVVPHGAI